MAAVRLWGRALGPGEVAAGMAMAAPPQRQGLVGLWTFGGEGLGTSDAGNLMALDRSGG